MKGNIPPKPVEYKGVQYRSIGELARALGIWKTTLSYRLKHGLTPDKNHKKRPCCGLLEEYLSFVSAKIQRDLFRRYSGRIALKKEQENA